MKDLNKVGVYTPISIGEQRAEQLYGLLRDGRWYLAEELAQTLGLNAEYIRRILRRYKAVWGLESRKNKGYRIGKSPTTEYSPEGSQNVEPLN
jgi:hypothetical protein